MKKLLLICSLLWSTTSSAQFVPGQVLTAAELNSAFANTAPAPGITCLGASSALNYTSNTFSCNAAINAVTLGGATFSAPGPIGSVSTSSGAFSSVSTPSATIGGGSINATTVGATSASTGAFTTLSASSTVSGAGFTTLLSPYLLSSAAASTYAPITSPTFTGTLTTANLTATGTVSGAGFTSLLSPYALIASPTFTGTVTAPIANIASLFTTNITPSTTNGIRGTTVGDNVSAGGWGEYLTNSTSGTSLTSNVTTNATSLSLTAGDWDVTGVASYVPAGTTTTVAVTVGINTTSATFPAANTGGFVQPNITLAAGIGEVLVTPTVRISVASGTTAYLVIQASFSVSTATVNGFIRARRVR